MWQELSYTTSDRPQFTHDFHKTYCTKTNSTENIQQSIKKHTKKIWLFNVINNELNQLVSENTPGWDHEHNYHRLQDFWLRFKPVVVPILKTNVILYSSLILLILLEFRIMEGVKNSTLIVNKYIFQTTNTFSREFRMLFVLLKFD